MILELIIAASVLLGAGLMLLAAVGVFRLPDLPTRMHASTKAAALGAMLIMIGLAFEFRETNVTTRALAIIIFTLVTSPIAAHAIGRAAYFVGVPLWHGTIKDELGKNYDPKTHNLRQTQVKEDQE